MPAKKRKKKSSVREDHHIETKSKRRSAKQAVKALAQELDSSEDSLDEEYDEEVVVYNSDGCAFMNSGDQQHQLNFKIMAENVSQLRALIERLKGEAESRDKENNGADVGHDLTDEHSKEASREFDETSNDTQLPNDESSNGGNDKADTMLEEAEDDVEEEDLLQTQILPERTASAGAGQESDSRSAMSMHEEESSQDTNHTQPRRSSRAHKQTQRFAEMTDHDDDTMAAPIAQTSPSVQLNHSGNAPTTPVNTRRSSRRLENGAVAAAATAEKESPKVEPLTLRRRPDGTIRERITMKVSGPRLTSWLWLSRGLLDW